MASLLSAAREGLRGAWHTVRGGRIRDANLKVEFDAQAKHLGLGFFGRRRLAAATRIGERQGLEQGAAALERESIVLGATRQLQGGQKKTILNAFSRKMGEWRLRAASRQGEKPLVREFEVQRASNDNRLGALNRFRLRRLAANWGDHEAATGFGALSVASKPGFALRLMKKAGTNPYQRLVAQAQARRAAEQAAMQAEERRAARAPRQSREFEWPSEVELESPDQEEHERFMDHLQRLTPDQLDEMPEHVRDFLHGNYGENVVNELREEAEERTRKAEERRSAPRQRQPA
jgi:hypothetical protein